MILKSLETHVGSQKHILQFWDELTTDEKEKLSHQIKSIDFEWSRRCFDNSSKVSPTNSENFHPVPSLEAISRNEVAAVVLAGGQASRLGSVAPKGTIPLGLNVSPVDSLIGIQAAKLALLEKLAAKMYPGTEGKIQWLVMTSKSTEAQTRLHLDKVIAATDLSPEQVLVFSQAEIPAFDMDGNLLLENKYTIVTSPIAILINDNVENRRHNDVYRRNLDGNGGLFSAIASHLAKLKVLGVKYFHIYCIDNILCKVADPHFLGFVFEKGADVATKTVMKQPGELVGSVCLDNGKPRVTEYSELGSELATRMRDDGRLMFCAGSIANHLYTMEFLERFFYFTPFTYFFADIYKFYVIYRFCTPSYYLPFHRALKKISYVNSNGETLKPDVPNGIKLEQFVFDVFHFSKNFYIWEVEREDEFSPLKNAESIGKDCLSTCKRDLAFLNRKWLIAAGAKVEKDPVYLKTLSSYNGEGLDHFKDQVVSDTVVA
uniref:UDP-N-acetylglucosamine diphosphorylase n=1 Tax=Heterorhabditis bacteriophora TaxID=37862 RepID=A0A1I7XHD3_HETBA